MFYFVIILLSMLKKDSLENEPVERDAVPSGRTSAETRQQFLAFLHHLFPSPLSLRHEIDENKHGCIPKKMLHRGTVVQARTVAHYFKTSPPC